MTDRTGAVPADVDGDGDLDLVAWGGGGVSVVENVDGGWSDAPVRVTRGADLLAVRDLDEDGLVDLVAYLDRDDMVRVHLNRGDLSFSDEVPLAGMPNVYALGAVDVGGHDEPDVYFAMQEQLYVVRNLGGGGFAPHELQAQGGFADVRTLLVEVDLDQDGDSDLLTGGIGAQSIHVYWNEGGALPNVPVGVSTVASPAGIDAGDLDGDGDLDLVVTDWAGHTVSWHERLADGFAPPQVLATGVYGARPVLVEDLDRDGDADVVVSAERDDAVAWLRNDGDLGFTTLLVEENRGVLSTLWLADVDGDGDPELGGAGEDARWMRWIGTPDRDGDRLCDTSDRDADGDGLDAAAEAALGTDPLAADTDGDGLPDGAEAEVGADPTRTDTDGDGLGDLAERDGGTDPARADSDGDGVDDGFERWLGTDPLAADTDGDGVGDGDDPCSTAPDADDDGLCDPVDGCPRLADLGADADLDGIGDACDPCPRDYGPTGDAPSAARPVALQAGVVAIAGAAGDLDGDGDGDVGWASGDAFGWVPGPLADRQPATAVAFGDTWKGAAALTSADLDGDGLVELVGGSAIDGNLVWVGPGRTGVLGEASGVAAVAVGDFDGDGAPDLAAGGAGGLLWLRNDGTSGPWPSALVTAAPASILLAADLDGDGDDDLVAADPAGGIVRYDSDGGGFGAAQPVDASGDVGGLAVLELDGDGVPDLVASHPAAGQVTIHRSGGDAVLVDVEAPGAVAAGDLDGDGRADLVVAGPSGVSWLRDEGGGALGAPAPLLDRAGAWLAVHDLDGSGADDVVVGGSAGVWAVFGWVDPDRDGDGVCDGRYPEPLAPDAVCDGPCEARGCGCSAPARPAGWIALVAGVVALRTRRRGPSAR